MPMPTTHLRVCGCGSVAHRDAMGLDRALGWLCDPCAGVNPVVALTLATAEASGNNALRLVPTKPYGRVHFGAFILWRRVSLIPE